MRKLISAGIAALTALSLLVGCGSASTATKESAPAAEGEAAGSDLNIAILSAPSGVDDGSFNQNNYEGIQAFISRNPGSKVTPIKEETGDPAACISVLSDVVADYDVIVCCGFQFSSLADVATANPEVKFILVDTEPTNSSGETVTLDNVYSMSFREQESGFCAGLAAALETKSGKVASVHGVPIPPNVNYQWGFESGVNYANAKLGTKAEIVELPSYAGTDVSGTDVGGNYVGDFADEATGKVIGDALYDQGADIIFVSAGGSGNGVFTAAKERGNVFVIGCDVDQYSDGENGSSNIVLTSVLKVMGMNVEKQLDAIKDGTFKGGNYLLGADTGSTGFISDSSRCQLSPETIEKMNETFEKVKNGSIVPPSNFGGTTPKDFTGLK